MNTVRFGSLLGWELRHVSRSSLLWSIVTVMLIAFVWGAQNSARLHRAQNQSLIATAQAEQQWLADLRSRAEQYQVSAAAPLPYWQDPTDIAGFSQYFLLKHSVKPHLAVSPLAVGVSDLLPPRLQVKLPTPFGVDASYDFHNPRGLALGPFDLAFAVVYLLPVALILLFGMLATYERDRGVLRLVAAQSVSPRAWLGARLAAIAIIVLPAICIAVLIALLTAGVSLTRGTLEVIAAIGLVVAYSVFWIAVVYVIMARWPRGSGAISALVTIWAVLAIGMPLLINTAASLLRPPALAAEYIDAQRRINDAVNEQRDDIVQAAFRSTPELAGHVDKIATMDHATRLSFLAPEIERRFESLQTQLAAVRNAQAAMSPWAALLTPPIGVEEALMRLAGTDLARHREFERQTREYQLQLRGTLYPLMHAQLVEPTPKPTPESYGRFSFTQYEIVPSFEMTDASSTERIASVMPMLAWLIALSLALSALATRRLRHWPMDL